MSEDILFSARICTLDVPSDGVPVITGTCKHAHKRIRVWGALAPAWVPSEAKATSWVSRFVGAAVFMRKDMKAHDTSSPVGCITDACVEGEYILVKGRLWRHLCPSGVVNRIKDLGVSFDLDEVVVDALDDGTLSIKNPQKISGVTLLLREYAAYKSTWVRLQ